MPNLQIAFVVQSMIIVILVAAVFYFAEKASDAKKAKDDYRRMVIPALSAFVANTSTEDAVLSNGWKRVSASNIIPVCRCGWFGVWDAIKAAITGDKRSMVEKGFTLTIWIKDGVRQGLSQPERSKGKVPRIESV